MQQRTRQAIEDAINGDHAEFDSTSDRATLRALRAIATSVDEIEHRLAAIGNRVLTVGGSVLATVVATAILLALKG